MTAVGQKRLQSTFPAPRPWHELRAATVPPERTFQGAESLRCLAEEADSHIGITGSLASVWPELRRGESSVADTFSSPLRHFVVLSAVRPVKPVSAVDCNLLERVLLSDGQKQAAMDCGMSESTLSMQAQRALRAIGTTLAPSKAPLSLAFLISASKREHAHLGKFCRIISGTATYRVVSLARPELRFATALTEAEYAVLCRLAEGWSYERIAQDRCTSIRTVANQTAAVFRQLQVSGRSQLLSLLIAMNVEGASEARPSEKSLRSLRAAS